MNDAEAEVYRALREAQNRYTYYLLFAAGAAIALCVNQTHGASLSWSQIPLAAAALCWALSFFFGCRQLAYVQSGLYANMVLLEVEDGRNVLAGGHPLMIAAASQGIRSAIEHNSNRANRFGHWQFRLLVAGAMLYVCWHVLEMYLQTGTAPQEDADAPEIFASTASAPLGRSSRPGKSSTGFSHRASAGRASSSHGPSSAAARSSWDLVRQQRLRELVRNNRGESGGWSQRPVN